MFAAFLILILVVCCGSGPSSRSGFCMSSTVCVLLCWCCCCCFAAAAAVVVVVDVVGNGCATDPTLFALSGHEKPGLADKLGLGGGGGEISPFRHRRASMCQS